MTDGRVVRLQEVDAERAAAVLVRAFRDDPFHVHLFPDPDERDRMWLALYTAGVRFGCLYGESWAVTDPAGEALTAVAYGFPMPGGEFTPERMERSGLAAVADLWGARDWQRFETALAAIEAAKRQLVPAPHWYLLNVGTDPAWQRRGLAGALVERFLARAAADRVPACLWTMQPANVPFYERHGLAVAAENVETSSGLRYWIFRRLADTPEPIPQR
jgi:GNAT superfamily N-acetyltransferase